MLPRPQRDEGGTSLRDMWGGLRRQRWIVAAAVASTLALGVVFLMVVRPVYESEATLRIVSADQTGGLLSQLPDIAEIALPGVGSDVIDTEMGVLRSRRIADEVITGLGLQVGLREPELPRDSVLQVLGTRPDTSDIDVTLVRQSDGSYRLRQGSQDLRVVPGQPFSLGPAELALAPSVARTAPARIRISVEPYHETLEQFRKTLSVDKQEGRSELVEIAYRSNDPLLAAAVVDAVLVAFVSYKEATDRSDLRRRVETLQEQVASYHAELETAEDDLRRYREQYRIVEPEEEAAQQVKMAALVRSDREQAMIERQALRSTLDNLRAGGSSGDLARQLAAFPTFITNQGVQNLLSHLNNAEEARSQLLQRRTPENAEVRRLDERIEELELQLYQLATAYLRSLDDQIGAADESLARFGAVAEQVPQREMEYARRLRQQRLLNEIYLTLQGRLEEAQVQYATAPEQVRVIDTPFVSAEPAWPRPFVTMVLAGFLGLMLGMMVSVAREAVDTTVRTRDEVEAITGIPVVAAIPHFRERPGSPGALAGRMLRRLPSRSSAGAAPSARQSLLTAGSRNHEIAEAFRAIPATIAHPHEDSPHQAVLVTSPAPGEGKSVSAANLAVVLAQQGKRTLLVDADLRAGTLHDLARTPRQPGLAEVLRGEATLESAIRQLDLSRPAPLDLLAAGGHVADPPELFASGAASRIMADLRASYDRIVVDSPDLLRYTDALTIAALTDSVLIVVRSGSTDRDELRHAVVRLERMGLGIAGIVFNDVDVRFSFNGGNHATRA